MGCGQSDTNSSVPPKAILIEPLVHNEAYQIPILSQPLNSPESSSEKGPQQVQINQAVYFEPSEQQEGLSETDPTPPQNILSANGTIHETTICAASTANSSQLRALLLTEIKSHPIYGALLDAQSLGSCFARLHAAYLSSSQQESFIALLLDYHLQSLASLPDDLALSFVSRFAGRMFHLSRTVAQDNKGLLKVLGYVAGEGDSFLDLKFDLGLQEVEKVVGEVKRLLPFSEKAFYYILLYLQISAFRLQNGLLPLLSVENKLAECFHLLASSTLPLPPTQFPMSQPDFRLKDYPKTMIDFRGKAPQERVAYLESYIRELAGKAKQQYHNLWNLMLALVEEWGYPFQIHSFADCDRAFVESNRCLIDVQMQKLSVEKAAKDIEELSLEELYFLEKETYKEQFKEILAFVDGQLEFKIANLLYSQCLFPHTEQTSRCVEALPALALTHGFTLVSVTNRLNEGEGLSQVLVKLSIDRVPVEIHLMMGQEYRRQVFNRWIGELTQNSAFSCFTRLKMINDSLLPRELAAFKHFTLLLAKEKDKSSTLRLNRFKELESLLPFKLQDEEQIDSSIFSRAVKSLALVQEKRSSVREEAISNSLARLRRVREFKKIMRDPSVESEESSFYRSFQREELSAIEKALANGEPLHQQKQQLLVGYAEYLRGKGLALMEAKVLDKAQQRFEKYADIGRQLHSARMLAEGRRLAGLLEHRKGNFNKALLAFQKCIDTLRLAGADSEQVPALISMGKVYAAQEKHSMALEAYGQCEELLGESEERQLENVEVYWLLGEAHCEEKRLQTARAYFERCLELQQRKSGLESKECIAYMTRLSSVLHEMGEQHNSIQMLERCLRIAQSQELKDKQATLKMLVAQRLIGANRYKEALECLGSCLKLMEDGGGKVSWQYSECLKGMGEAQEGLGQYEESVRLYEQALGVKQKVSSREEALQVQVMGRMARLYGQLGNPSKSQHYQQRVASIQERSRDRHGKEHLATYTKIADNSLQKGNYPTSLKYYHQALEIIYSTKGKDASECIPILRNMGLAYKHQGRPEEAIKHFSDSLSVLEKGRGKESLEAAESYYQLGSIYEEGGEWELGETYYSAALHLCDKYNIKYNVYALSNYGLANIYLKGKLYSKAFESYEKSLPVLAKLHPALYSQAIRQMDACDREIELQFPHKEGREGTP